MHKEGNGGEGEEYATASRLESLLGKQPLFSGFSLLGFLDQSGFLFLVYSALVRCLRGGGREMEGMKR
jgi:hypothetical protein